MNADKLSILARAQKRAVLEELADPETIAPYVAMATTAARGLADHIDAEILAKFRQREMDAK